MTFSEDQITNLMNLLKIPTEKQNFEEFRDQIQNLIEEKDRLMAYYQSKTDNTLEKILNNPGLQHIAENIFDNLDSKKLEVCRGINQSSKQILDSQMVQPKFLLRQFRGLSKKNEKDWTKVIDSVKDSEKIKAISSFLQWNLKKDDNDLPCYTDPAIQDDLRKKIWKISKEWRLSNEHMSIIKMLVHLTDNPNARGQDGCTPIHWASSFGYTEIVKILVPFTDNPNALDEWGNTPIHNAARNGRTEIVKILAPLTDKPNADENQFGETPMALATKGKYYKIVRILDPRNIGCWKLARSPFDAVKLDLKKSRLYAPTSIQLMV